MAPNEENPAGRARASAKHRAATGKRRRAVRKLAGKTLVAAGLLVAQLSLPEIDARYPMFHRGLLDKLHPPITRHPD